MTKPSLSTMINYLQNFWNSKLLTSCLLCLSLGITNAALAEYKKPPNTKDDAPDSRSTSISGIRGDGGGCSGTETTNLTAFAPYTHIGQTTSIHPTFAWFVPDRQSYPVELQLSEYSPSSASGKGNTILKVRLKSSPGIMSYSLPKNQLGLSSGQKYVWQVAILCNPNHPSEDLVVSTETIVVDTPTSLQKQLTTVSDSLTRANLYAEAGLWYDALAEAVRAKNNPQAETLTYELIEELIMLEKLNQEENINTNDIKKQGKIIRTRQEHQKRLKQILEANTK
ncbi:MAG: DUF928 domain-containing protein [Xenococcaceae cyanobacterium MO_188.B32]|nr:DUF928 domain-containing protein [Xenococcaceae cyanobacterium MO_188.B32]